MSDIPPEIVSLPTSGAAGGVIAWLLVKLTSSAEKDLKRIENELNATKEEVAKMQAHMSALEVKVARGEERYEAIKANLDHQRKLLERIELKLDDLSHATKKMSDSRG